MRARTYDDPRVGDVFTIPYDDDRVAYGQIVDRYGASGGHGWTLRGYADAPKGDAGAKSRCHHRRASPSWWTRSRTFGDAEVFIGSVSGT